MRIILLFFAVLCCQLFPQLKELEVKPTENRGGIPIFRDHPDKAGIIFYTQFDDLKFYSSYGIVDIKGDPAGGKYVVIIEPVRQTIEVRAPGYKTEMIRLNDLQPRDVLYYEVLPKKEEGISEVSEVGVTIQATPQDAIIKLDGATIANDRITLVSVGKHTLIVEKPGYNSYSSIIEVTPQNTLFKVTLTSDDPSKVVVSTMPEGAEIFIDGISKGKTRKAFFLYPGTYDLRLFMQGYLQINERINVSKDELKNEFTFNLQKNTGNLILSVSPAFATVRINKEVVDDSQMLELAPGTYQIEVEADTYLPFKGTVNLQLGETKTERISLVQKTGKLQFTINPPEAECVLSLNGVDKYRWTGLKIISDIPEGKYDLSASANGYQSHFSKTTITFNQTTIEEITLIGANKDESALQQKRDENGNLNSTNSEIVDSSKVSQRYSVVVGLEVMEPVQSGFRDYYKLANGASIELNFPLNIPLDLSIQFGFQGFKYDIFLLWKKLDDIGSKLKTPDNPYIYFYPLTANLRLNLLNSFNFRPYIEVKLGLGFFSGKNAEITGTGPNNLEYRRSDFSKTSSLVNFTAGLLLSFIDVSASYIMTDFKHEIFQSFQNGIPIKSEFNGEFLGVRIGFRIKL